MHGAHTHTAGLGQSGQGGARDLSGPSSLVLSPEAQVRMIAELRWDLLGDGGVVKGAGLTLLAL